MIRVELPDGSIHEHSDDTTALDIATGIGERLAAATLAAEIDALRDSQD